MRAINRVVVRFVALFLWICLHVAYVLSVVAKGRKKPP